MPMSRTLLGKANASATPGAQTLSVPISVPAGTALMLIAVSWRSSLASLQSITFQGGPGGSISDLSAYKVDRPTAGGADRLRIYQVLAPSTGWTSVEFGFSAFTYPVAIVTGYAGTDSGTPSHTAQSSAVNAATAPADLTVASTPGTLCVGWVFSGGLAMTHTVNGAAPDASEQMPTFFFKIQEWAIAAGAAATTVLDVTRTDGGSAQEQVFIGFGLRPPGSGGLLLMRRRRMARND